MVIVGSQTHLEAAEHPIIATPSNSREFEADVRIEAKEIVATGVVILSLREIDGNPLPKWEPGAHVDLIVAGIRTRQYSLCGDTHERDTWRLGILRDPNGSGSSVHVHDHVHVGDTVRVRGPRNDFWLLDSPAYLFIAGGIGITPILPMIAAAEASGAEWQLLYGGRRRDSMAFLDELASYGDKVSIRPQADTGDLDLDGLLAQPRLDMKIYCCGPEPLLTAVEQRCRSWPAGALHVERFKAKPLTAPVLDDSFEVYLAQSELTLIVPPGRTILEVVEEAGVELLSSCSEGTCGTCETVVLDGVPDHRDSVLTDREQNENTCMMVCVSRARTNRLVLDL